MQTTNATKTLHCLPLASAPADEQQNGQHATTQQELSPMTYDKGKVVSAWLHQVVFT